MYVDPGYKKKLFSLILITFFFFHVWNLVYSLLLEEHRHPGELQVWPLYLTHINLMLNLLSAGLDLWIGLLNARNFKPWQFKLLAIGKGFRAAAVTMSIAVAILFWTLVYNPNTEGTIPANILAHGMPAVLQMINLLVMRSSYSLFFNKSTVKNLLLNTTLHMSIALSYAVLNGAYVLSGGKNEMGHPYLYRVIPWQTQPIKALLVSFIGILSFGIVCLWLISAEHIFKRIYYRYLGSYPPTVEPQ